METCSHEEREGKRKRKRRRKNVQMIDFPLNLDINDAHCLHLTAEIWLWDFIPIDSDSLPYSFTPAASQFISSFLLVPYNSIGLTVHCKCLKYFNNSLLHSLDILLCQWKQRSQERSHDQINEMFILFETCVSTRNIHQSLHFTLFSGAAIAPTTLCHRIAETSFSPESHMTINVLNNAFVPHSVYVGGVQRYHLSTCSLKSRKLFHNAKHLKRN